MTSPVFTLRSWSGFRPTACALAATLAGAFAFLLMVDHSWRQMRKDEAFLPTDRAPEFVEAIAFYAMDYAVHSQEKNDVVFIGDSTCVAEIEPTLFEQRTGLRAYNLGVAGALGYDGYEILLQAYLEHHPKPQIIAFCLHPSALSVQSEPRWVGDRFANIYGSGLCIQHFTPHTVAPIVRSALRITAASDTEAFANMPMPGKSGHSFRSLREAITERRGFWAWPPGYTLFVNGRVADDVASFPVTKNMEEGVAKILRLAGRYEIPVLFRFSPILANGKYDPTQLKTWLDAIESSEDCRVVVGRPELIGYDRSLLAKEVPEHCNQKGADEFTRFIADEVAGLLHNPDALANSR
jgi:hypothetical protein